MVLSTPICRVDSTEHGAQIGNVLLLKPNVHCLASQQ
jgi:hypothetical protein